MTSNNPFKLEQLLTKTVSHKISSLVVKERNIEMKCIVIKKIEEQNSNNMLTKYLVADNSGSIYCNFYGENGKLVQSGDILYLNGYQTNKYKGKLILYEAKSSKTIQIGRFMMEFVLDPNRSLTKF